MRGVLPFMGCCCRLFRMTAETHRELSKTIRVVNHCDQQPGWTTAVDLWESLFLSDAGRVHLQVVRLWKLGVIVQKDPPIQSLVQHMVTITQATILLNTVQFFWRLHGWWSRNWKIKGAEGGGMGDEGIIGTSYVPQELHTSTRL